MCALRLLLMLGIFAAAGCSDDPEETAGGFMEFYYESMTCAVSGSGSASYTPRITFHVKNIAGDKAVDVKIAVSFFTVGYANPDRENNVACRTTTSLGDFEPGGFSHELALCTTTVGCAASYSYYFTNVSGMSGGGP